MEAELVDVGEARSVPAGAKHKQKLSQSSRNASTLLVLGLTKTWPNHPKEAAMAWLAIWKMGVAVAATILIIHLMMEAAKEVRDVTRDHRTTPRSDYERDR